MKKKDLQERFEVVFRRYLALSELGRMSYQEVSAALLFVSEMGIIDDRRHLDCLRELFYHFRLECFGSGVAPSGATPSNIE